MNEQAIHNTVDDFHKFCRYIVDNNPVLTKAKTNLGKRIFLKSMPCCISARKLPRQTTSRNTFFSYSSSLIHYFNYFGWCDFIPITDSDKKITRYDDSIAVVIPTELGVSLSKILLGQEIIRWNVFLLYLFDYGDSWEFNIVLEKTDSNGPLPLNPEIVEKKGKAPEQYNW